MIGKFNIKFSYRGKNHQLPARLIRPGYSIKLETELEGQKLYFEPDGKENWRAFIEITGNPVLKLPDPDLLKTISACLSEKFK